MRRLRDEIEERVGRGRGEGGGETERRAGRKELGKEERIAR